MHPLSSLSIASCLAFLVNHALVHAATTSPSITGAPVNTSTITGTGFIISTATGTADGYQVGDEILSINDPSKYDFDIVQSERRFQITRVLLASISKERSQWELKRLRSHSGHISPKS